MRLEKFTRDYGRAFWVKNYWVTEGGFAQKPPNLKLEIFPLFFKADPLTTYFKNRPTTSRFGC